MKNLYTLLMLLAIAPGISAQKIRLVKDINRSIALQGGSNPAMMASLNNGNLLFTAYDSLIGRELWISDGTATGTKLLIDLIPGTYPAGSGYNGVLHANSTPYNNKLIFMAADNLSTTTAQAWVSDGTVQGTFGLKDPANGSELITHYHTGFTEYKGDVYFASFNGPLAYRLWRTDATNNGTKPVAFVDSSSGVYPQYMAVANGKLFFMATKASTGQELWVTDGTTQGTKMIADLAPGTADGVAQQMVAYNNKLFFSGRPPGTVSYALCSTDGNTVSVVKNNIAYSSNTPMVNYAVVGGHLYFIGNAGYNSTSLFISDGTTAGTKLFKNFYIPPGGSYTMEVRLLGELNNQLVFAATDNTHGRELWITDGTATGTHIIKDINPNGHGYHSTALERMRISQEINVSNIHNNIMYFAGDDGVHGIELWQTDGTAAGTYMVEDVARFPDSSASSALNTIMATKDCVWLGMSDGKTGNELYRYDLPRKDTTDHISSVQKQVMTRISPNPNRGSFTVQFAETLKAPALLRLIDMTGRIVYRTNIATGRQQERVTLNIPAGIYSLHLTQSGHTESQTISIVR